MSDLVRMGVGRRDWCIFCKHREAGDIYPLKLGTMGICLGCAKRAVFVLEKQKQERKKQKGVT